MIMIGSDIFPLSEGRHNHAGDLLDFKLPHKECGAIELKLPNH
jgi:hypothetical protein